LLIFQSYARGIFGRQHFIELRANVKAIAIQRIVRGWLARRRYKKVLKGFIKLQAHVRRIAAKKELKKLKVIITFGYFNAFSQVPNFYS
jgi:myosin V